MNPRTRTRCGRLTLSPLALLALSACATQVSRPSEPEPQGTAERRSEGESKRTPEVEAELVARRARITAELAGFGASPWAGSYAYGDGFDVNVQLDLAPENGCAFRWSGCMGDTDQNWGTVREVDGELLLAFALPNVRGYHCGAPEVLVPVPWGERRYLIEKDAFLEFCNLVNLGREPRDSRLGHVLLCRDDWAKPAPGRPEIPAEFRSYLPERPIVTTVAAVGAASMEDEWGTRMRHTPITLPIGSAQGVFLGMTFVSESELGSSDWQADVIELGEGSCVARVCSFDGDPYGHPALGQRCSTRD